MSQVILVPPRKNNSRWLGYLQAAAPCLPAMQVESSKGSVTVGVISSPFADSCAGEKLLKGRLGAQGLCQQEELFGSWAEIPTLYRVFNKPMLPPLQWRVCPAGNGEGLGSSCFCGFLNPKKKRVRAQIFLLWKANPSAVVRKEWRLEAKMKEPFILQRRLCWYTTHTWRVSCWDLSWRALNRGPCYRTCSPSPISHLLSFPCSLVCLLKIPTWLILMSVLVRDRGLFALSKRQGLLHAAI